MKTNAQLRAEARAALKGHWGEAMLPVVVYLVVAYAAMVPYFTFALGASSCVGRGCALDMVSALSFAMRGAWRVTLACILVLYPLEVGFSNAFKLFLATPGETPMVRDMFRQGFGRGWYLRNVAAMLLVDILVSLWSLLLIVPGIIKRIAYEMTPYTLADCPDLGPGAARRRSEELMRGHKLRFFGLMLSFVGWILLSILTLGIGLLWVIPYMQTAHAAFYRDLLQGREDAPEAQ